MSPEDKQILKIALDTESSFSAEIERLAGLCADEDLSVELFCYLNGLKDLKEDFLLPTILKTEESRRTNASSLLEEKYSYFQRT